MHKTEKVYLAPLIADDSEILFNWINERDLVLFNSSYKPVHHQNHRVWFENIVKSRDTFIFGIRRVADDHLIGSCQLNHLNFLHRNAELQIRIGDVTDRGKGFGGDAVRLLLNFAFNDLNLNKVYLNVFATNVRAIRTYEKTGFRQEGELIEHVFINGEYVNIIVMATFRKDYKNL